MKGSSQFHFKQFSVSQDRSTHKIGTDGVLLGAWADVGNARRILDIGAGTGVISLMLAQRTGPDVLLDAVEVEKDDADQAAENARGSPWKGRITVHHTSIQQFSAGNKYDLIVSNPPFFTDSLLPPEQKRRQARHTWRLSFGELLDAAIPLLRPEGRLALILPVAEGLRFMALAEGRGLVPARECLFRTRKHKPAERLLMELSFSGEKRAPEELVLYDGDKWSEDYLRVTRDFYLNT